jgi:DNA-binding NarL/FixJ family response regulator
MKILIADDHWVVRRGVKELLSGYPEVELIGEASNGEEVLKQLYTEEWDILILDLSMPDKSGLDVLIEVKQRKPEIKVLILTMNQEDEVAMRAIKTGASGYLTKDSVPEELIKAVKKVYAGGRYISAELAETIAFSLEKNTEKQPHEFLSDREFQVLCLIASGNSLKQIGENLCINVKTVSTYRTRILEKLNMKSNVELTHYAIKHRLVLPS